VNYRQKKWANAAYLAQYCLQMTNDDGALPRKLNARQRVAPLYLLYRARWWLNEYAEAVKAINYCWEGLIAFRDTISDEQKKVKYFQNLETVLADKFYLLVDGREILNALKWLDEGKAPILKEIMFGKTKASRSPARAEPAPPRESPSSSSSATRSVKTKKPPQNPEGTAATIPIPTSESLFGEVGEPLEDKKASRPGDYKLNAGEIAVAYFLHRGENRKHLLFTIVYVADQPPFALKREVSSGGRDQQPGWRFRLLG
jgi:hypothetical protein